MSNMTMKQASEISDYYELSSTRELADSATRGIDLIQHLIGCSGDFHAINKDDLSSTLRLLNGLVRLHIEAVKP